MFLKPSIFEWVKKLLLMKCLYFPPSDMFVEPKEVYMTPKINQRVEIYKAVRCSTNNGVFYLDFFYLESNKTTFFIQYFSFLRIRSHLLKKSLVENLIFWALIAFTYKFRLKTRVVCSCPVRNYGLDQRYFLLC